MNLLPEGFTPEYSQAKGVQQLVDKFNRGDLDYLPNRDKERIASLAAQYGANFKTPSKPVKKALFDFTDTLTFGLVPNRWRPTSIGEEYFGESREDRIAGNIGSLFGLAGGVSTLLKGAKKGKGLWDTWRSGSGGSSASSVGNKMAQLNSGRDTIMLGSGAKRLPSPRANVLPGRPNLLQLGPGRFPSTPGMTEAVDTFNLGRRLY